MTQAPTRLVHLTTADISLSLLLGPQLRAFATAGYEVIGISAPGPHVPELESWASVTSHSSTPPGRWTSARTRKRL